MRLYAFGGDARMDGALGAARHMGWETWHIRTEADAPQEMGTADAVLLPWPVSFAQGKLAGCSLSSEQVMAMIPPCRVLVHGRGIEPAQLTQAGSTFNPGEDETFLRTNAQLTAEGAIARAMEKSGRALHGSICLITGFGRIAQALCRRLTAMEAFVIVCARNELQMRRAHEMGAHPVPLDEICTACAQAEWIFNTVPARILSEQTLRAMRRDAMVIELASAPYGLDVHRAEEMGVQVAVESGLPGRYAPENAGKALFEAAVRKLKELDETGGKSDG